MRHIGTLPTQADARRFADYALTKEIRANVEPDGDDWAVWIIEEDQVPQAKTELEAFREHPEAERYVKAKAAADAIRDREIKKHRETKKKVVKASDSWNRSLAERSPVTLTLIILSVVAVLLTTDWKTDPFGFGKRTEPARTWLSLAPIYEGERPGYVRYPKDNTFGAILRGEVWRLFTPMFLHFGPLHLLFNMMWLRDLGSAIEVRRGRWKFLLMVLFIAALSNAAQGVRAGPSFGGMSGVVFGLFGYVWMQSRFVPESGFFMPPNIVILMLIFMFLCYFGIFGPIANTAHSVGLISGMALGYAPKLWRDLTR